MAARSGPRDSTVTKRTPVPPQDLVDAINRGKCAVFVGAGLSCATGYPGWVELLRRLTDKCYSRKKINKRRANEIRNLINEPDKLLMVAQELREILDEGPFRKELADEFRQKRFKPTKTHLRLMQVPFSVAVTTNYDMLLEEAYQSVFGEIPAIFSNSQVADIADAFFRSEFFILKAHGDVRTRASMIITERDYREIIFRSPGYQSAVSSLFVMNSVLFLGVGLNDPELRLLLSYLHDAFHGGAPRHYALVPSRSFPETARNRWDKDFNVECLDYQASKGHPEVHEFVKRLPQRK